MGNKSVNEDDTAIFKKLEDYSKLSTAEVEHRKGYGLNVCVSPEFTC